MENLTVLERQFFFQLIKELQIKSKTDELELAKEKRSHFLYLLFCPKGIFLRFVFYFIVYRIQFQNIHTFAYQKTLLHALSLLVSKIVESLQCILKKTA